jgi:hypothetical protein
MVNPVAHRNRGRTGQVVSMNNHSTEKIMATTKRIKSVGRDARHAAPGRVVEQALFGAVQVVFMGLMLLFSAAIFFDGTAIWKLDGSDVAVRAAQHAKQVVVAPRPVGEPRA